MPAMGRQLCRCPAALQGKMLAPRNGGTRLCRQWGANSAGVRTRSRAKCWRLATDAQGFAGNGAPTRPAGRGASGRNVGASQRRHKALPAMGRQLGRRAEAPQGEMLTPRNGDTWLCRQWGANSGDRQRRLRAKCWRLVTDIHGSAGNGAPTRPAAGYRPALGGKFSAGALKAEKENGRGHSPFPLSLNRKLPAGRRKLTNCYSYAVYRSSRYLYRSSASFMYCDAPENILDKLNR